MLAKLTEKQQRDLDRVMKKKETENKKMAQIMERERQKVLKTMLPLKGLIIIDIDYEITSEGCYTLFLQDQFGKRLYTASFSAIGDDATFASFSLERNENAVGPKPIGTGGCGEN